MKYHRSLYVLLTLFSSLQAIRIGDWAVNSKRSKLLRTSRSFLFPRPVYHSLSIQFATFYNALYRKTGIAKNASQAIGIFQQTIDSRKLAAYFLMNCQGHLFIAGDTTADKIRRNIRAEWLNLPSDFSGQLIIRPFERQASILLEYNQDLYSWFKWELLKYTWIDIAIPLVYVKNSLQIRQIIHQQGTTQPNKPNDIIEAFNQPQWHYGKIAPYSKSHFDIGEIKLSLGVNFPTYPDFLISTYSSVIIPTSNKQKADYLFNPFIGINGHLGFSSGVRFELPLHEDCWTGKHHFILHAQNTYYLKNKQYRMLDLKDPSGVTGFGADMPKINRQWSRYLLLRKQGQESTVPGINILTQRVEVHPYNTFELLIALKTLCNNIQGQVGYNLWARSREKIRLRDPKCETQSYNFQSYGIAGSKSGSSAHCSTICQQASDDSCFICIKPRDISKASGTYPGGISHRLYTNIDYVCIYESYEIVGSLGGFYEFPHTNTTLKQWGIWGQTLLSF